MDALGAIWVANLGSNLELPNLEEPQFAVDVSKIPLLMESFFIGNFLSELF